MTRRNLILIHRGPEYEQDFTEISEKIYAIDPNITIFLVASGSSAKLPNVAWTRPTLTVAFNPSFALKIRRGTVLRNRQISKLTQYQILRDAGLPIPPMTWFQFGMKLDPIVFGEFVVIKPMTLSIGSQGRGIQLFRRRKLETMKPSDFPASHAINKDKEGYLVQKFIDTGETVPYNRVLTLFSEPMYSYFSWSKSQRGSLDSPDEIVEKLPITNNSSPFRERVLKHDDDALALAKRVHDAFPDVPLLGIDIIREHSSGRLFVLECNPGGNTWHFSSKMNIPLRRVIGGASLVGPKKADKIARQMHIDQFGAFDRAAQVLVEKTRQLAS